MEFFDRLRDGFDDIGESVADWGLKILVAVVVLIIGRWIIGFIRKWVTKLLESNGAQAVFNKAGVSSALEPSGRSAASLVASILGAVLLVVLWLIIFQILDVEPIVDLLERLLAVLPLIAVAVALVIIAAAAGNFVSDLIRPYADQREVSWLPSVVRVVILLFGVLAALDLLQIEFAEDLVKIVTAAAGVAFAIAFGIGGVDTAKQWWAKLNPRS